MSTLQQNIHNQIKIRIWVKPEKKFYYMNIEELLFETFTKWQMDELVISRFTGLSDKLGVEIYEGDIVKDGNYVGVVEWGVGRAGFIATGGNQSMAMTTRFGSKAKDCEVIGNIYENPELITNLDKKK